MILHPLTLEDVRSLGWLLLLSSSAYAALAAVAVKRWLHALRRLPVPVAQRPVSVLKPLHGDQAELYDNLRSFCEQDYPEFQLVFGVHDADDTALAVVHRLRRAYPALAIDCVVDDRRYGSNHKVSNLINIERATRHDWLVLADSDIRVDRDYLRNVTAPLASPSTGIVTCLYRGRATGSLWSQLGTLFIDGWFTPSALIAHLLGSRNFAFGATIALRRDVLNAAGGLAPLANLLADDYELGARTRAAGFTTVLSETLVATTVAESSASALARHELRWLRTIRTLQPGGFVFMFPSFGLATGLLGLALTGPKPSALAALAVTALLRCVLHYWMLDSTLGTTRRALRVSLELPLLLARDGFSLVLWSVGLFGRRVQWGNHEFTVARDGSFRDSAG